MKLILSFPFPIAQIRDNAVEVSIDPNGKLPLPELEIPNLEESARALGVSEEKAEQILIRLQGEAMGEFLSASLKHRLLPDL
jgi:hypothetical protein